MKRAKFTLYILFSLTLLLGSACAVSHTKYRNESDKQLEQIDSKGLQSAKEYRSLYLLGNAGASIEGSVNAFYDFILDNRSHEDEGDYLILLGDNFKNSSLKNTEVRIQLDEIIRKLKDFNGHKLIVPGENEWNERRLKGLYDLQDSLEDSFQGQEYFQPEKGCPLETIEVDDDTELIIIDSQWYIENWDKQPNMNDKCTIKTRAQLVVELKDKIKKAGHKNVVIIMHHPLYSNGIYGGKIPLSDWYRPKDSNVFIPGLGMLFSFLRSQGGISKQDRFNPMMNELMSVVENATNHAPRTIILSAHEQSLQYIPRDNIRQVISGSSSRGKESSLGSDGDFSSGKPGFAEIRLFKNGSSRVLFYGLDKMGIVELIFSREMFAAKAHYPIDSLSVTFPPVMEASIYPEAKVLSDERFERLWGKHYRYVYGLKVKAPVAILDTLYGGLKVERAGGGNQTLALRLVDKTDREYNMRALAKDPISFLQASGYNDLDAEEYFGSTFTADLIEDFYTAAHPYGAFVIAELSHELKLKHTHPKLYYVPKQRALGDFNVEHGDRLYMIEQKPDEDFEDSHMFGNSDDVMNTTDILEELRDDESNRIDETEYIRARIFDILLGDWDRHEGQWSWAKREENGYNIYSPVPRDRDQVFANFDGRFLETLQKFMGQTRQFGKYGPNIDFVENFSESAINLDRAIIQRSQESIWYEQVGYIQSQLNEQNVAKAFENVPERVRDTIWEGIQRDLLARKKNLNEIVGRYLDYFYRFQTLKGTDKDDYFTINRKGNGDVHVVCRRIKDGEQEAFLFDRTFKKTETSELWIYGLDDKDVFQVEGSDVGGIDIKLIGGLGNDSYDIRNGRGIKVYDQRGSDNEVISNEGAKVKFSRNYSNRIYNPENRPRQSKVIGLKLGYNPDEGFFPLISIGSKKVGFERNPFTNFYKIDARYLTLTQAFELRPEAHFANMFARWNLKFSGRMTSNNFTRNFFGFGNDTKAVDDSYDSNRVYTRFAEFGASTYRNGPYGSSFEVGLGFRNISVEESVFLADDTDIGAADFFVFRTDYQYKSVDDEQFPAKGMVIDAQFEILDNFGAIPTTWSLGAKLVFINALTASQNLVLQNSLAAQFRLNDGFPFYNAASLGADSGLRSYRQNRFAGNRYFVTSTDIKYNFKPLKTNFFPVRLSSYLGADLGRVWYTNERSNIWHYSYGMGIQSTTAGALMLRTGYFRGPEGGRLNCGLIIGI